MREKLVICVGRDASCNLLNLLEPHDSAKIYLKQGLLFLVPQNTKQTTTVYCEEEKTDSADNQPANKRQTTRLCQYHTY